MSWELSLVFKATVVLGGALVAVAALRRTRASRRHLILAAAFVALLALPGVERLMPTLAVPVPVDAGAVTTGGAFVAQAATFQSSIQPRREVAAGTARWPSARAVVATIWMVGGTVFLLALCGALWRLNRLRRAAEPWAGGQAMADTLVKEMGATQKVTVAVHDGAIGPAAMGMFRSTILLPREAVRWQVPDLRRVLIHEIEHVRRGDWSTHLLVRVVCIVYWFHPLAWIAWRHLSVLAERACDDAVVARANRADYAEQLVTLAGQLRAAPRLTLSMAGRSALSVRVAAILNERQARGRAGRLAGVATVGSVAVLAGSVASLQAVATLAITLPTPIAAQSGQRLEFEVATVKPVDRTGVVMVETIVYPGGRLVIRAGSLVTLVSTAYGVASWQVSGEEPWMRQDLYAIEAKPPAAMESQITNLRTTWTGIEDGSLRLMLQSLLSDRFKLELRRESASGTVYSLERTTQPLRLKEAIPRQSQAASANLGTAGYAGGKWAIGRMSMGQFAEFISSIWRAPVVDRTGLEGAFEYRQVDEDVDPKYGDQQYLQESLIRFLGEAGLRLRRSEGSVDKLVIVSAQRPPEN